MTKTTQFQLHALLLVYISLCLFAYQTTAANDTTQQDVVKDLRAVTLLDPPFVMMSARGANYQGFAVDVLNEAVKEIGYDTFTMVTHSDARFGMEESPGKWNGLIGAVQNESADVAVAAFSMTAKRSEAVEFTQPFMVSGFRVLYKIPDSWHPGQAVVTMLKPFSAGLWTLIILMFVLASCALYAIGRYSPFEDVAFIGKPATYDGLTLPNSFLYIFSALVLQGYTAAPKSISGRVLAGVWWVFVVMTIAAYVAGLTVLLFRVNPEIRTLPFTTLDELSRQKDIGLLVVKGSTAHKYLQTAQGQLEKKLMGTLTANEDTLLVSDTKAAMKMMMESEGRLALLMEGAAANYLITQQPCDMMVIGERLGEHSYSFACRHSSDVCKRLSTQIIAMREDGRLSQFEQKWFHSGCLKDMPNNYIFEGLAFFDTFGGEPDYIVPMKMTVTRFSGAFIFLVLGLVVAGLVLGGEIWWARKRGIMMPRKLEADNQDDDIRRIENDFHDDPNA